MKTDVPPWAWVLLAWLVLQFPVGVLIGRRARRRALRQLEDPGASRCGGAAGG